MAKRRYDPPEERECLQCGGTYMARACELRKAAARGHERKFCGSSCQHEAYRGDGNPKWKGGKYHTSQGYVMALCPGHPRASKDGYVLEHRLVMEAVIGRFLHAGEVVHHINHVKDDNRPRNLRLLNSEGDHRVEHADYREDSCGWCGQKAVRSVAHRRRWKRKFCNRQCAAAMGSWEAQRRK